jgi:hypothetical protein
VTVEDCVTVSVGEIQWLTNDVAIRELRNKLGVLLAIEWQHNAPGDSWRCDRRWDFVATTNYIESGWTILSEKPLSLAQSLLCNVCKRHGLIRDGKWVPA